MHPQNRKKLADRVTKAAEAALASRHYVSAIDVLVGIGWLDPGAVKRWQQGQVDYLERVVQTNLSRISEAMKLFRSWAAAKGLIASETAYVARTPARQTLRFSKSGSPRIEQLYRTHWVSTELSEKKRQRVAQKAARAPELVVIQPLHAEWKCHRCGGSGDFLIMENPGPACLRCSGLADLEFLRRGTLCSRVASRRRAKDTRWSCVSAGALAVTSDKACWSSRRRCNRRRRGSASKRKMSCFSAYDSGDLPLARLRPCWDDLWNEPDGWLSSAVIRASSNVRL